MAHLLIIDLPGGNDTDIFDAAINLGHSYSFLSSDIPLYLQQPKVASYLERADAIVDTAGKLYEDIEKQVLALHKKNTIDAVLCLIDIRLIQAAKLAEKLHVHYLNSESAILLRDKFNVRRKLAEYGIAQPEFALAESTTELVQAVHKLGLPVLIKPADGYGSQNIISLLEPEDLDPWISPLEEMLPSHTDYGLGVKANDRLLVERYMEGSFIGCDTFTVDGEHYLLGVNEKKMFAPPSFAIQGGCFTPRQAEHAELERYVFSLLRAVNFNWGAAHIELMMTKEGPRLVEINPRLVGARIGRLIGYALNRSIYEDLIALHLGSWLPSSQQEKSHQVAITRWIVSAESGTIKNIALPDKADPAIKCVEILKHAGDAVHPPFENADRIGYVMTASTSRDHAEALADRYITEIQLALD